MKLCSKEFTARTAPVARSRDNKMRIMRQCKHIPSCRDTQFPIVGKPSSRAFHLAQLNPTAAIEPAKDMEMQSYGGKNALILSGRDLQMYRLRAARGLNQRSCSCFGSIGGEEQCCYAHQIAEHKKDDREPVAEWASGTEELTVVVACVAGYHCLPKLVADACAEGDPDETQTPIAHADATPDVSCERQDPNDKEHWPSTAQCPCGVRMIGHAAKILTR